MRVGAHYNSCVMDCRKHELPVRRASAHSEVISGHRRLACIRNIVGTSQHVVLHRLLTVELSHAVWERLDMGGRHKREQSGVRWRHLWLWHVGDCRAQVSERFE